MVHLKLGRWPTWTKFYTMSRDKLPPILYIYLSIYSNLDSFPVWFCLPFNHKLLYLSPFGCICKFRVALLFGFFCMCIFMIVSNGAAATTARWVPPTFTQPGLKESYSIISLYVNFSICKICLNVKEMVVSLPGSMGVYVKLVCLLYVKDFGMDFTYIK
jgi:hypothetical protein